MTVGGEGAQTRPYRANGTHLQRRRGIHGVDAPRHVQLLGAGVAGHVGRLVGRRTQQLRGPLGLEVEPAADVGHQRPAPHLLGGIFGGRGEGEDGAAQRRQAQGREPGAAGDLVRPCPGGIDDDGRRKPPGASLQLPAATGAVHRLDRAAAHDRGALPPGAAQERLVQAGHVDVVAPLLEQAPRHPLGVQDGTVRPGLAGPDDRQMWRERRHLLPETLHAAEVLRRGDPEDRSRLQQFRLGQAVGIAQQEVTGCNGERLVHRSAIGLDVLGGRPSRAVRRQQVLPLEHDDVDPPARERVGGRHACDAASDDDRVT